ncbi:uncharacterized protein LOC133188689 [Saccostrea echinata]|uniref:uncharacterized protein LOC133188689 n=1 Tax=Saccostrea echinata TaxID=191078 RepID=UPI002A83B72C|nr:uncharacterized protein LOC133188689 [Saccostrea echinata]
MSEKHKPLRLPIGWLNYSYAEKRYKQVKNTVKKRTGTTTILLTRSSGYEETKTTLEEEFFPGGKSSRGKLVCMDTELGTFKGIIISPENFTTVGEWVENEQEHQQKARLYLLTKKKLMQDYDLMTDTRSTDSSDSDFLPRLQLTKTKRKKTTDSDSVMSYTYCHAGVGPSTLLPSTSHTPCSLATATPTTTAAIAVCNPLIDNSSGSQNKNISTSQQPGQQWLPAGTPTVLFQQGHAGKNCTICFDREISHFFLPCGHTTCLVCGLEIETHNRMCPVCRLLIQEVKPLFM